MKIRLLTKAQVAEVLAITEAGVDWHISHRSFPVVNTSTGKRPRIRIRESDLIAFIESRVEYAPKAAS